MSRRHPDARYVHMTQYAQVLPDDGGDYNDIASMTDFDTIARLAFSIKPDLNGIHTVSLRWAGGDNEGGGDSLYVVMRDAEVRSGVDSMGVWGGVGAFGCAYVYRAGAGTTG